MPKPTATEATRQQYELAWEEHWIYRKLFDWYGDAYLKAKSPRPPWRPPAFEPAMRDIIGRASKEWTDRTRLPALDACDPETWWAAAIAAGMDGQPVSNVRELSARGLTEIILPWALAKMSATKDDPVAKKSTDNVIFSGTAEPTPGDSAFVPAGTLWHEQFKTLKELTRFRQDHPGMFRNPSKYKLEIHAGQWASYWAEQDKVSFNGLGEHPSIADDPETGEEFLKGAADRLGKIRAKKKAGKR